MNYLKNIFSTGAVRKTPLSILKKINSFINPDQQLSVIELGAGKGEITRSVLNKIPIPETYLAFEIDKDYCRELALDFPEINVVNDDAFRFSSYLTDGKVDLVISSMPLSFYKKDKIQTLLTTIRSAIEPGGKFIIIFHAVWLLPILRRNFPGSKLHVFPTIPLYFLLYYTARH